jgi:argininosuccinate lyase
VVAAHEDLGGGDRGGGSERAGRTGVSQALWAGRLAGGLHPDVLAFTASLEVDRRLLPFDLAASAAHARMLGRQGLIPAEKSAQICTALETVRIEPDATDEDVHSAIERLLGELGPWVHAGRSRNDQVQTAMRLWAKDACDRTAEAVRGLAVALLDLAGRDGDLLMPGYTHGQRAQPVWLGQHLAAHVWSLERDLGRIAQARDTADVCPLGAGALAGSSLPLDPASVAEELGFARVFANSMDAVSDRDYCAELVFAGTLCFVHLSRLAEELVLWTSAEYGFAQLDDSAATGSSIMPQKKNPDAAELTRGKAGTAIGRLTGLLATLKGLALAYNRDLQEDKRACFDQVDDLLGALRALTVCIEGLRMDGGRMAAAASDGTTVATDLAERLVLEGTPFRHAHAEVAGRIAAGERFASPTAAEAAAARQSLDALHEQLGRAREAVSGG